MKNTIKEVKQLVQTPFVNMYDIIYTNKKDEIRSWILSTRKTKEVINKLFFDDRYEDSVDAVILVAFHKPTKSIVCIKQFRMPVNSYIYELPAGLIDKGEDLRNTLKRELKEETGLELLEILDDISYDKLYLSPGMTDESVAFMYCTCEGDLSMEYLEDDEDIEPLLLDKIEAKKIIDSKSKKDIKLYIILNNFVQGLYDEIL